MSYNEFGQYEGGDNYDEDGDSKFNKKGGNYNEESDNNKGNHHYFDDDGNSYNNGNTHNEDNSYNDDSNYSEANSYDKGQKHQINDKEEEYYKAKKQRKNWHADDDDFYEEIKSPGKGRTHTLSIAIPSTILEETCILDELRTNVVGQIARAANIYSVDEIIVYDDGCWKNIKNKERLTEMMKSLLEYQECPQYLRKLLFGFNSHLRKVGVLNALNCPHHLQHNQWCKYREGVVLGKGHSHASFAEVGLSAEISLDKKLEPGTRVTVKIPPESKVMSKPYGVVVSPDEPREKDGFYWGYAVRVAESLSEVLTGGRYKGGYDLMIGTSDKGKNYQPIDFPSFKHALIVFGGVQGLETALRNDAKLEVSEVEHLFDHYVNTCPIQQTRTIRTEEAVLISLSVLSDKLLTAAKS